MKQYTEWENVPKLETQNGGETASSEATKWMTTLAVSFQRYL